MRKNMGKSIKATTVIMFMASLLIGCGGGGERTVSDANTPTPTNTPAPSENTGGSPDSPAESLTNVCGQASGNSIQATWDVPVDFTDGSALTLSDISFYTLYYGTRSGDYTTEIDINDKSTTTCTISDLPSGDYFLSVTVTLTDGRESEFSNEIYRPI